MIRLPRYPTPRQLPERVYVGMRYLELEPGQVLQWIRGRRHYETPDGSFSIPSFVVRQSWGHTFFPIPAGDQVELAL